LGEEEIAAEVVAGTDTIAVPTELVEDVPVVPPSLLQRIQAMNVSEKIKLALRGNREARGQLIHDSNSLIRRFVLQNPRVGDEEIIAIAKNRSADDELLRIIATSRAWTRTYQVRLALVTNPKTPLTLSIRFLGSLYDRDVRALAKSKNVSSTISTAAKRLVLRKGSSGG
jgi:hypothetical protein